MTKTFKIFSRYFVLVLSLLFCLFLTTRFSKDIEVSAQTPIEISTLEELYAIRDGLAGDYLLVKDLDFRNDSHYENIANKAIWTTGEGWVPIGTASAPFTGTFDGSNHKISHLFINRAAFNQGLFGSSSGTVRNLGLIDENIRGSYSIGGLIGSNNGAVTNSYSTGEINATGDNAGGLVGSNNGTITFSSSRGVVSGVDKIGGLVGNNSSDGRIDRSYSSGTVSATGGYAGGLTGQNFYGTIINSYSNGDVSGSSLVGGLVGDNFLGAITNSYSTGNISAGGESMGGLIGQNQPGTVTHSYWDTQTAGVETSAGGTGKTTLEMKSLSTFDEGWDILGISSFDSSSPSTWYIDDGNDYPRLFWQYSPPPPVDPPPVDPPPVDPPPVIPPVTPTPTVDDTKDVAKEALPKTGVFANSLIIVTGVIILFFGLGVYKMPNQAFLFFGYRERFERKIRK